MRLILVRHGQTTSNVHHLLDTAEPGADLTDLGRTQAAELPARLADETIAAINVSTLVRTQQTAAPLAAALGLTPVIRAEGREISAGDHEMSGEVDHVHAYVRAVFAWVTEDPTTRFANGETGEEVLARFDTQVDDAVARAREVEGGAALVVAHGSVIRYWIAQRSDIDTSYAAYSPLPNTGIVILEGDGAPGGQWRLVSYDGVPAAEVADGIPDSQATEFARDERE